MKEKLSPIPEGYHTVSPYLILSDGAAALDFYTRAFAVDVTEKMIDPATGRVRHAEFRLGTSMVMMGEHPRAAKEPSSELPTLSLYLYVEDVDMMFEKAVAAGATVINPPDTKHYGNRECGITDPFGIVWWMASRVAEFQPA